MIPPRQYLVTKSWEHSGISVLAASDRTASGPASEQFIFLLVLPAPMSLSINSPVNLLKHKNKSDQRQQREQKKNYFGK